jgi:hypothetical protein
MLIVGIVFIPELRDLVRVILETLWGFFLDLIKTLAGAISSL